MSLNPGNFKKGHVPYNKGVKGLHLSPKTEFKVGQTAGNKSKSWKGGVQTNKHDCVYVWVAPNVRKRRPVAVWEANRGKIPNGYVVYHLDGNKDNDNINNLAIISRGELVKLNIGRKKAHEKLINVCKGM